jgi:hypothetical protein
MAESYPEPAADLTPVEFATIESIDWSPLQSLETLSRKNDFYAVVHRFTENMRGVLWLSQLVPFVVGVIGEQEPPISLTNGTNSGVVSFVTHIVNSMNEPDRSVGLHAQKVIHRGFQKMPTDADHPTLRGGLRVLLAAMVTTTWSAFEKMASDLWETALNKKPEGLAELNGEPPNGLIEPKSQMTALASEDDKRNPAEKMLRLNFLQKYRYNVRELMGTILREKFNFQIHWSIREAYISAFDRSHPKVRGAICDSSFVALAAARNVFAHNAGVVDQDFINQIGGDVAAFPVFQGAEKGEKLPISGPRVKNLIEPCLRKSSELIEAVIAHVQPRGSEPG